MVPPSAKRMRTLESLPGLGPKRLEQLRQARIFTSTDLLHIAPSFSKEDSNEWHAGARVHCLAEVLKVTLQFIRRRGNMLTLQLRSQQGHLFKARFFNAAYLKKRFQQGDWYRFQGTLDKKRGDTIIMPSFQHRNDAADDECGLRFYKHRPLGISNKQLNEWIDLLLDEVAVIEDPIQQMDGETYTQHIRHVHDTQVDEDTWRDARNCLALREQCSFLWQIKQRKINRQQQQAPALYAPNDIIQKGLQRLGFPLSPSQEKALEHAQTLLAQNHPSYSLLQGDVGCGKSAVALMLAWLALHNNYRVLYLAPTRLLAQQQYHLVHEFLNDSEHSCQLIQGQQTTNDTASASFILGTHALLQESQQFENIGLIIIDEQQKFGVEQRQALIDNARCETHTPHVCMLSATPIPRSLGQSLYGDLDIINIDERPQQHASVTSSIIKQPRIDHIAKYCREAHGLNQQCICICAYLDTDDKQVLHARKLYQRLCADFPEQDVVLIHGQMPDEEQQQIYDQLQSVQYKIIVATSVIEVGFNLPQAIRMLICNSERFGLAQLHQMRGRLGRGRLAGHCYFATPQPDQHARLQELLTHNNGFAIAEADYALRGSGDLLGSRQHGAAQFYCPSEQHETILSKAAQIIGTWNDAPKTLVFYPQ